MPCYDYRCPHCNNEWESFNAIKERHMEKCQECGQKARIVISATAKPVVLEGFDEHLDAYITGPKQRKRIMDKKNLAEKD